MIDLFGKYYQENKEVSLLIKRNQMEVDKQFFIEFPKDSTLTINDFRFEKNIISKIRVVRWITETNDKIFIQFYSGHLLLSWCTLDADMFIKFDGRFINMNIYDTAKNEYCNYYKPININSDFK